MSILKFTVGKSGAGGANSDYITRLSAAEKISFHNLGHLESNDVSEARTNAIAYAYAREEIELAKNKNARTHYRMIASFEGKKTSEEAAEEVGKYLKKEFPDGRAIIAVHQDTDDTHVHVWLDTRKTDGGKLQIGDKQYHSLDESWTTQYDARYGTGYAPEYKAKKEETKQYKREMLEWRMHQADGQEITENIALIPPPMKPERASDRMKANYWRAKEIEELSGSKELPNLADKEKPSASESHKPIQPVEEKKQIIEQQVESYILDLQRMMRERRETLIIETAWATRDELVRQGAPTDYDKIKEHAARAVDHFIEKGSYQVRNQIREVIEQGTHVGEQLVLADKSGSDAVHEILRNAADGSRTAVIELSLENYGNELHESLGEFYQNTNQIDVAQNSGFNVENYEKNGLGTGYSTAQSGSRRAQNSERITNRAQSEYRAIESPERRGDHTFERTESPVIPTEYYTQQLSQPNNGFSQEFGTYSGESEGGQFNDGKDENQYLSVFVAHNDRNEVIGHTSTTINRQEVDEKQFSERRFREFESYRKAGINKVSGSSSGTQNFGITNVEFAQISPIELSAPLIKPNAQTFVLELTKMMSENLRAQQYEISERAWHIMENQWRSDALKPAPPVNAVLNQNSEGSLSNQTADQQYDSKLEADYYRLTEMKNAGEKKNALNKIASVSEQKANEEREYGYDQGCYDDEQRGWSMEQ